MVLIQRFGLALCLLAGCSQSLFDNSGASGSGGGGSGSNPPPSGPCTSPCVADAATDFDGSATGATHRWRYLDDHRDRTWTAMTPGSGSMTGADPANHIKTCASDPSAPACAMLADAVLVSSAGATAAADPALEITAPANQVVQLTVHAIVPSGDPQQILIYRNSREDALFTGVAMVGTQLDQVITLDALAGDRLLVALAPAGNGAADVGLSVRLAATGAAFPSACQIAMTFTQATGNTMTNLCGDAFTYTVDGKGPMPPALISAGPYAELGSAATFKPDDFYQGMSVLDRTHDTTTQFWFQVRTVDSDGITASWLMSDMDLDTPTGGGLGITIVQDPVQIDVTTCTDTTGNPLICTDEFIPFTAGTAWHFLRAAQTGDRVDICLDGKHVQQMPAKAGSLVSTFPPYLGKNVVWTPSGAFLDGAIDDVRVVDGALPCK